MRRQRWAAWEELETQSPEGRVGWAAVPGCPGQLALSGGFLGMLTKPETFQKKQWPEVSAASWLCVLRQVSSPL